jgi:TonB family protein
VRITGMDGGGNVGDFTQGKPTFHTKTSVDNSGGTDALWVDPDPAAVSSAGPNMVGQLLGGRYLLERELGGGGMGVVYLASDQEITGELFAIKVLKPEIRAFPEALPLLREEVRTTRALRHPNIVGVYSLNSDRRNIYMLMEYLEGKTLDALLDEEFGRGMPFSRAWPLILDMCDALAYAHDHNVIHSDLKPSNVFVTIAGRAKLLDFGIARVARTRNGRFDPGTVGALTLAYASIEMLEGNKPDQRDDVYALACVIYEMLSGRHPYDLHSALEAHLARMPVAPIASLTPAQNAALAQALTVGRANRTSTVEALLASLDASSPAAAAARPNANPTLIRERRNTVPFAGVDTIKPPPISPREPGLSRGVLIVLISLVSIIALAGISALIYRARARPELRAVTPITAPPAAVTPTEPTTEIEKPSPETASPQVAPPGTADTQLSTANDELPAVAPTPVAAQTPPVVPKTADSIVGTTPKAAPPILAAAPHIERRPAQNLPNQIDSSELPAVSKHPLAVAPLAESIDSCPYPETALKAGRTGSVGLLVYISPDGGAVNTRLDESSGSEDLDRAAVACVQEHGRFSARHLGSKVPGYWGRMRFNWSFGG